MAFFGILKNEKYVAQITYMKIIPVKNEIQKSGMPWPDFDDNCMDE